MTGYILTRIDIAALLKADRMVVHYNGGNVTESRIWPTSRMAAILYGRKGHFGLIPA